MLTYLYGLDSVFSPLNTTAISRANAPQGAYTYQDPLSSSSAPGAAPSSRASSQAPSQASLRALSRTPSQAPTRLPSTPSSTPRMQAALSPALRRAAPQLSNLRPAVGIASNGAIPPQPAAVRIPKEISDNFLKFKTKIDQLIEEGNERYKDSADLREYTKKLDERMEKVEEEVYAQRQDLEQGLEEMRLCLQDVLIARDTAHTIEPKEPPKGQDQGTRQERTKKLGLNVSSCTYNHCSVLILPASPP